MPQHDMLIANAVGATFRADINDALAALVANSSGAAEPATKYAYMLWADTTAGVLKQRNAANTAWITKEDLAGSYEEGAVTLTLTGCTTSPTMDFRYIRLDRIIILSPNVDNITGTSNSTSKTLTGLPSALAPQVSYYDLGMSVDNGGAVVASAVRIASTGIFTLQPTCASASWTASGSMIWYPRSYAYVLPA